MEVAKSRVLIADDDADYAKMVEAGLKHDVHQIRVCPDGEATLHLVRSWMPHIVLLDINMPKLNGIECLKKIRALAGTEYIGALLVTANSELEQTVRALDSGADDYLVKPCRMDELRARIRACLRVKNLHDSLRRANKRLEDALTIDDVTSLHNMRFGIRRLTEEVETSRAQKTHLSCVIFDMDHFKSVNEKQDHLFGSHVLREVAQLAQTILRPTDIAARYGGDEFLLAMPGVPIREAFDVAERMRKSIEAHVFRAGAYSVRATASFGVSGTQSTEDFRFLDVRDLMRSASAAVNAAKSGGRNRTETLGFLR